MHAGEDEAAGDAGADGAAEAVEVLRPDAPGRFVFASPHSGVVYPPDLGADPDLPEASLRSAEDALVDRLIAPGLAHGAVLVLGRIARTWVDLNRAPGDLDPALVEGVDAPASPRAMAGYGVVPRLTGDGRPPYWQLPAVIDRGRIDVRWMLFVSLTATSRPQLVRPANVPFVVMSNGPSFAQSEFLTPPHDQASQPTSSCCASDSNVR